MAVVVVLRTHRSKNTSDTRTYISEIVAIQIELIKTLFYNTIKRTSQTQEPKLKKLCMKKCRQREKLVKLSFRIKMDLQDESIYFFHFPSSMALNPFLKKKKKKLHFSPHIFIAL